MKNNITILPGSYYFKKDYIPVAIHHAGGHGIQHLHDFTRIEHLHDFIEIAVAAKGQGIQNINGKIYPVKSGDVFVIQDHTTHYFPEAEHLSLVNVMFSSCLFESVMGYLRKIPGFNIIFQPEQEFKIYHDFNNLLHLNQLQLTRILERLKNIKDILIKQDTGFETDAYGALLAMISDLAQCCETSDEEKKAQKRIEKLLSTLEVNIQRNWKLSDMAHLAAMSETNLLRTFQTAMKTSPIRYLLNLRLQRAADLLRKSDNCITEIAYQVGFHDSNYFSKQFRDYYGIAPRSYRM